MSVVAVKIENNKIHLSADSSITKGDLQRTCYPKLKQFDDLIVGGCGSAEELCLFFEYASEVKPQGCNIRAIQSFMFDFYTFKEEFLKEYKTECSYIVCYKGKVFEVDGLFVQEITSYGAIGQGEYYAMAALYLGHSAEEAVKVACELSCFVAEPIVTITTDC